MIKEHDIAQLVTQAIKFFERHGGPMQPGETIVNHVATWSNDNYMSSMFIRVVRKPVEPGTNRAS